jgi:hypothetical protein
LKKLEQLLSSSKLNSFLVGIQAVALVRRPVAVLWQWSNQKFDQEPYSSTADLNLRLVAGRNKTQFCMWVKGT